jgi:hypothetical protein
MPELETTDFDLARVRDLSGRSAHVWYRRVTIGVLLVFVLAALGGLFGQTSHTRQVAGSAATVTIRATHTVRGGLLWPARIQIQAKQKIVSPQVVLGPGFVKGMQVNTLEPSATSETTRTTTDGSPGSLALTYPTLDAGQSLTVYIQLQVDPTTIGGQDVSVSLEGANIQPIRSPATLHVLP